MSDVIGERNLSHCSQTEIDRLFMESAWRSRRRRMLVKTKERRPWDALAGLRWTDWVLIVGAVVAAALVVWVLTASGAR